MPSAEFAPIVSVAAHSSPFALLFWCSSSFLYFSIGLRFFLSLRGADKFLRPTLVIARKKEEHGGRSSVKEAQEGNSRRQERELLEIR